VDRRLLRLRQTVCEHLFVSATILHADADSFFASVEQRDDPRLRGRPVIVGGGVVLAASYEAKAFGVRTAMGGRQALRLCPDARVVPARMAEYAAASKALFAVFEDTTPLVEGISIDEAFLDVRGMERLAGTPREIAARLRRRVREEVGLPVTVGIARTKFLAKVASAAAKPDGLLFVPRERELAFLHPLPVERIWGVGAATAQRLHGWGIATVGDLAATPEPALTILLGKAAAAHLHALAWSRDPRVVHHRPRRRSIGSQHAFGRRPRSPAELDADLVALVERVMRRVRRAHRLARTIVLRLRFGDYSRATRSHTIARATASTRTVLDVSRSLLASAQPIVEERGLTLIGVAVTNLTDDLPRQLELPVTAADGSVLDHALDEIKERFGAQAVTRAVLLRRPPDVTMPLMPD
jgi:DNA polymerase-4